jgi:hypothetical protein
LSWTWFRRVVPQEKPWRNTPMRPEDEAHLEAIWLHLNRGRPLADDSFPSKLESKRNRRLRPRPVGRPMKKKADKKTRKTS